MGDGAAGGQIEDPGPGDKGGAGATADEGRTGRQVRIVGTAKPEVGDLPAGGRIDQARRLRRDQRRDADGPQQPRFQQQRLAEGRGHSQQGLVGEGDGSLGHGQDLAGEPEAAQLVEERRVVGFDPGQVGEVLLRVSEVADEGQRRLQPRGQEIRSPERRRTGVEVERRRRVLTPSASSRTRRRGDRDRRGDRWSPAVRRATSFARPSRAVRTRHNATPAARTIGVPSGAPWYRNVLAAGPRSREIVLTFINIFVRLRP